MERSEKFGLFEKQGLSYATWFCFCVQPLFDDNIIKNSYSFSKLFSKYAWKRLERCLDPAHSPFSQEGPKGLESACTTTKVYDQKSQNFCTQDVQRLVVNSINLTSLQAVTLLGSQKLIWAWKKGEKKSGKYPIHIFRSQNMLQDWFKLGWSSAVAWSCPSLPFWCALLLITLCWI